MEPLQTSEYPLFLKDIPVSIKKDLYEILINKGVKEISDTQGMIMMSVVDIFDTTFHLGEVLAREIKVEFNQAFGTGIVMGDSHEDAFITASANAAEIAGLTELSDIITETIKKNAHYRINSEAIDRGIASVTKVNFGLMVEG